MTIKIISDTIQNKKVILDDREINILDFGDVQKTEVISTDNKISSIAFIKNIATQDILLKYNINNEQYDKICNYLEDQIQSILF